MIEHKDLPKVAGRAKPAEVYVWTVYIKDGQLRARLHPKDHPEMSVADGSIEQPENIFPIFQNFMRGYYGTQA